MNEVYKIIKLKKQDAPPLDLLLLADETKDAIEKYIYSSDVYVVHENEEKRVVAVFVLQPAGKETLELKNIAVAEQLQGKGLGSLLMHQAEIIARKKKYKEIIVGTPDGAKAQIGFYEKNGYVKYQIRKNFFKENYSHPIIEDGVMLKDMQMLRKVIFP